MTCNKKDNKSLLYSGLHYLQRQLISPILYLNGYRINDKKSSHNQTKHLSSSAIMQNLLTPFICKVRFDNRLLFAAPNLNTLNPPC